MSEKNIDQLCEQVLAKREAAKAGGGEKAIAKQHEKGKLTARERVETHYSMETMVRRHEAVCDRVLSESGRP